MTAAERYDAAWKALWERSDEEGRQLLHTIDAEHGARLVEVERRWVAENLTKVQAVTLVLDDGTPLCKLPVRGEPVVGSPPE